MNPIFFIKLKTINYTNITYYLFLPFLKDILS